MSISSHGPPEAGEVPRYRDPVRIVSLLPSATEILFAIGAGDDVRGVTFECDYPVEARLRTIVSSTELPRGLTPSEIDVEVRTRLAAGDDLYTLDKGALGDLDPDLVVTQDLCAVCAVASTEVDAALDHLGCHAEVLTLDPMTLAEVMDSIGAVGRATGCHEAADELVAGLMRRLDGVATAVAGRGRPGVAVLEWTDPPFSSGHWVPDMVEAAGGRSLLGRSGVRSSRVDWDDVTAVDPDLVVVAPCGFRLDGAVALAEELVARGRIRGDVPLWAVDADAAFVRPGPRLMDGIEALAALIHPGALPRRDDLAARVGPGSG